MFKPNLFFTVQQQDTQKVHQPLFFRAIKDRTCIYLLGTNHRLPITVLPQCVTDCINKSQTLCCERTGISEEEITLLLSLEPFKESSDNKWFESLSRDAKQIIDEYLVPHIAKKFPGKSAKYLKDEWVIAELRAAMHCNAMDIEIRKIFTIDQKTLHSLDNSISKDDWIQLRDYKSIKFDVENPQKFSQAICDQFTADHTQTSYMIETVQRQLDILETNCILIPKQLGEERHVQWLIKLEQIINSQQQHLFIAVGASHLVGETGLLQWLQKSGYTIECINNQENFEPFYYELKEFECVIL